MARTRLPKGCDNCPPSSAAPRTKTIARSEQEPRKLTCAHLGSRNTLTIAFPRYNHVCAAHVRARLRTQFRRCLARDRRAAGRPNRRPRQRFHSLSFLEACASQHSRRAKNLRAFLGFEFGHAGLGGRTNQTKQGNEFHARTRRRKNWRGKIRFWETFAPWPLCVSL